jgi:hypothetical protein
MAYIGGWLGKSGWGIIVPISPKIQTNRESIGYDAIATNSPSTPGLVESRKVLFVVGEVQIELLDKKSTTDCHE